MANVEFQIFKISGRRISLFIFTALAFGLAIYAINHLWPHENFWSSFFTEQDISTFFCERTFMDRIIRQPTNTFSNFIYFMGAIAIIRRGWKDQRKRNRYNIISANPFYSILLGFIMLYIFLASTFFHSSLIHFASELDFSAVYSLSLYPLMYFTHRVWLLQMGVPSNRKHTNSMRTLMVIFTAIYLALTFFLPEAPRNYVVLGIIIALIVFGIMVERRDPGKTNVRYLVICIMSILIAVTAFGFDIYKVLCNPDSLLQPHSIWHLFSGVSAFYFYMYIRSERNKI